jgi:hypothetical protein
MENNVEDLRKLKELGPMTPSQTKRAWRFIVGLASLIVVIALLKWWLL